MRCLSISIIVLTTLTHDSEKFYLFWRSCTEIIYEVTLETFYVASSISLKNLYSGISNPASMFINKFNDFVLLSFSLRHKPIEVIK